LTPTLFLIVAKTSLQKHSVPYWSNPLFNFLTSEHSGGQSWAPECPMSKNWKGWVRPVWP